MRDTVKRRDCFRSAGNRLPSVPQEGFRRRIDTLRERMRPSSTSTLQARLSMLRQAASAEQVWVPEVLRPVQLPPVQAQVMMVMR